MGAAMKMIKTAWADAVRGLCSVLGRPSGGLNLLIAVHVLALVAFLLAREVEPWREPIHGGRTISQWLGLRVNSRTFTGPENAEALRAMGASAVPPLTRALRQRSGLFYDVNQWLYRWLPPTLTLYLPEQEVSPEAKRQRAAWALGMVGPAARPALPAVLTALQDRDVNLRRCALAALTNITSDPAELLPPLTERLRDWEAPVRLQAVDALARLGPASRSAVPAFATPLTGAYAIERTRAALGLLRIDPGNADALRVLTNAVQDPDRSCARLVARELGHVTSAGALAMPLLDLLARDPDATVRERALQARAAVSEPKSAL